MSSLLCACRRLFALGLLSAVPWLVSGQTALTRQGGGFSITGILAGDQNFPDVVASRSGGYVVWQDNLTDGEGLGISALRLNADFSRWSAGGFRLNTIAAGDQENAKVALLKNGGAVFVWQGGASVRQNIYARFVSAANTFVGPAEIMVNTETNTTKFHPAVSALSDGNVVVVWSSFGQDESLQGVYAQRLSATGEKLGAEFQVNQSTPYNQRTPVVAALADGKFAVVWVSEQNRFENSVDVFGRLFSVAGDAAGNEFLINTGANICANPVLAASGDGGFMVAWGEKFLPETVDGETISTNSWDILARPFNANGEPARSGFKVNTYTYGEQFTPKMCAVGSDFVVVWTSLGQDGSKEGVYGQLLSGDGNLVGTEFRINTATASIQFQPAVATDEDNRTLVVWSSFIGGAGSFDLFAQQYSAARALRAPAPPVVSALEDYMLMVSWADQSGGGVVSYKLYMDDDANPQVVNNNFWIASDLPSGSTHSFRLAYTLEDGRTSPLSAPVNGKTWGRDANRDGLPDDWQQLYWPSDTATWPDKNADSDGDGAPNLQEFLAGTNPLEANSVLRTSISSSAQGRRLNWNSQPGFIYQVQTSANFQSWENLGSPRFAVGTVDSIPLEQTSGAAYYRVIRVR